MQTKQNKTQELFIGTSGYSYGEWVDSGFYPPDTHSANMIDYYTEIFSVTELNYTWYQMPKAPSIERMCQKVPDSFRFAAKLTRTMTHEIKGDQWIRQVRLYREGIAPLISSGRLLTILIQLPPYFERTVPRRQYLAALLDELAGLPLAVEFRHNSWADQRVFSELARRKITLVMVDTPNLPALFPLVETITNPDLFYIRFHGRNAAGWGSGNIQKQFDYNYSQQELMEWANRIQENCFSESRRGCLFFNNHVRGQAPANALDMIRLLA